MASAAEEELAKTNQTYFDSWRDVRAAKVKSAIEKLNQLSQDMKAVPGKIEWSGPSRDAAEGRFSDYSSGVAGHADTLSAVDQSDAQASAAVARAREDYANLPPAALTADQADAANKDANFHPGAKDADAQNADLAAARAAKAQSDKGKLDNSMGNAHSDLKSNVSWDFGDVGTGGGNSSQGDGGGGGVPPTGGGGPTGNGNGPGGNPGVTLISNPGPTVETPPVCWPPLPPPPVVEPIPTPPTEYPIDFTGGEGNAEGGVTGVIPGGGTTGTTLPGVNGVTGVTGTGGGGLSGTAGLTGAGGMVVGGAGLAAGAAGLRGSGGISGGGTGGLGGRLGGKVAADGSISGRTGVGARGGLAAGEGSTVAGGTGGRAGGGAMGAGGGGGGGGAGGRGGISGARSGKYGVPKLGEEKVGAGRMARSGAVAEGAAGAGGRGGAGGGAGGAGSGAAGGAGRDKDRDRRFLTEEDEENWYDGAVDD